MRNEISHAGMISGAELQQVADELLLDLNAIITLIYGIVGCKYSFLLMVYEKLADADVNMRVSVKKLDGMTSPKRSDT